MMGQPTDDSTKGIIPKAFKHIFGFIDEQGSEKKFLVRCSFLEIYNENVLDLLGNDHTVSHDIKEDPDKGIYVKNLTSVVVKNMNEIELQMENGSKLSLIHI